MLDKESLIFHCESLLDQRLFLQQMKLTRLQQLHTHDARVFDSLSALKRYLPIEQPSHYLAFIFAADESQWLSLLQDFSSEEISSDFLMYLAELSIALEMTTAERLLSALLTSPNELIFDIGMCLATHIRFDISALIDLQGDVSIPVLKYMGRIGNPAYLDFLNNFVASFSSDEIARNEARVSRLYLGYHEDTVSILKRLIEQKQINKESLQVLFAKMSEEECSSAISHMMNDDNLSAELITFAMATSGCTKYTPFLAEFFADETCRDAILYGIVAQSCESLGEIIPYECFHPTREVAWSFIAPNDLEASVINWFHDNSQKIASRSIAGLEPSYDALCSIWQSGNSLQREQANLRLALCDVHTPIISPVSLWGGKPL